MDSSIQIIAMGASTGGPMAMAEILANLPWNLAVPILAVQHIAQGFTAGFAEWIGRSIALKVTLAKAGDIAQPGTVYMAPHGAQMGIRKDKRIFPTHGSSENGFCPSISYLFQSVAEAFGRSAIGVLLTGMGQMEPQACCNLETRGE